MDDRENNNINIKEQENKIKKEKVVQIKIDKSQKEKTKSNSSSIFIVFLLIIAYLFFALSWFGIFIFILTQLFDAKTEIKSYMTFNIIAGLVAIALLFYLIKRRKKYLEPEIDYIKIDYNKKNKCLNCKNEFNIEDNICPHCKCDYKPEFYCPNCSTFNPICRDECINCGEKISNNYYLNKIKKEIKSIEIKYILLTLFFIIFGISYAIVIIPIMSYYYYKKIKKYNKFKKLIDNKNDEI